MRYLSEQFKEKQNQLIRQSLELFFEVDTFVMNSLTASGDLGLDDSVAPIVKPANCTNEYYYEVLGDGSFVDDPNKICAPRYSTTMPKHSVPYGITMYATRGLEIIIGSYDNVLDNFIGIDNTIGLSFKGGLIPEYLRVERYDNENDVWVEEETIDNTYFHDVIYFTPTNHEYALKYRRFVVWNTQKSGIFQLNWIEERHTNNNNPIVFENNRISSITIDQETDLTSQTLPSYEMTVTCLDIEGRYSPDSTYWKEQFRCGTPCYFRACYRDVAVENIPFMFGKLTAEPTYSQNKITFKVAVDWKKDSIFQLASLPDDTLNAGDEVEGRKFENFIGSKNLFDNYDVFHGNDDINNSVCNYYGTLDSKESRQLVANALGCFITAILNQVNLHNTNDIQYESFGGYLTRYEQVQNTLASNKKVSDIDVVRNQFVLSEDYMDIEAEESVEIYRADYRAHAKFHVPFYAIGQIELVDAQSVAPIANVTLVNEFYEHITSSGVAEVIVAVTADMQTVVKPIVRFYKVDRNEFHETETVDSEASENYINNNVLITNSYTADKVKRVGRFISDVSNQYEVDVVQNFSRELGDIIRLETDKGVFKTCVITGLKFTFPGSKGHVTCRKIFAIEDSSKALGDIELVTIITKTGDEGANYRVYSTINGFCVMGKFYDQDTGGYIYIIVGATGISYSGGTGSITRKHIRDANYHSWTGCSIPATDTSCTLPMYDLGVRDAEETVDATTWGTIKLIMALYEEQGMTSPLDFDNYEIIT